MHHGIGDHGRTGDMVGHPLKIRPRDLPPLPPDIRPRVLPPTSDTWWWSLETCSNLLSLGPTSLWVTFTGGKWNWSTCSFQAGSVHLTGMLSCKYCSKLPKYLNYCEMLLNWTFSPSPTQIPGIDFYVGDSVLKVYLFVQLFVQINYSYVALKNNFFCLQLPYRFIACLHNCLWNKAVRHSYMFYHHCNHNILHLCEDSASSIAYCIDNLAFINSFLHRLLY